MSIRAIAKDLYRAQQRVTVLEQATEQGSASEQEKLRNELRVARSEYNALKRILEGEKECSEFRKKFQGFGE